MDAVTFKTEYGKPVVMLAPKGMENCESLYTILTKDEDNNCPIRISKWMLNDGDLEFIKEHKTVYLLIYGDIHPPVCVTVFPPIPEILEEVKPSKE